jgi:hypothetical protein
MLITIGKLIYTAGLCIEVHIGNLLEHLSQNPYSYCCRGAKSKTNGAVQERARIRAIDKQSKRPRTIIFETAYTARFR